MVPVRAVKVPAIQVREIEDKFGAELVSDNEPELLLALDNTLQKYRLDKGVDPDIIVLLDRPTEFFKHMVLNINFLGTSIPGSYNKPAWFRFRKSYLGARTDDR